MALVEGRLLQGVGLILRRLSPVSDNSLKWLGGSVAFSLFSGEELSAEARRCENEAAKASYRTLRIP
jgi:hypothetical protein